MFRFHNRTLRRGFSLIEVNMAIFVLAGGALALMSLFPMGLRYSAEARNEMRVAAFAERFTGAAQIAANDPNVGNVDDLAAELATFGFHLMDDPGDYDDDNIEHDSDSDVYYRAWIMKDDYASNNIGTKEVAEIGVQVTAENAKQNRRLIRRAPIYTIRVTVDTKNKR